MHAKTTELETRIIAAIERQGPITFRDFMETALYDSELGYYSRGGTAIGPGGDFFTSSNLHPIFGAILAEVLVDLLGKTGPESARDSGPGTIIEMGAGTGRLAARILEAIESEHKDIFARLSYIIVEISDQMRRRQREELQRFERCVRWATLDELEGKNISGVVFSNEFVDALPVHRIRFNSGRLEEQFVIAVAGDSTDTRLSDHWSELSDERLTNYVARFGLVFEERQVLEVNLDAIEWLRSVSRILADGFILTIDYGDIAPALLSRGRREGTLRCFYRHRIVDSPFEGVGERDITSSVNFSALQEYGRDLGLEAVSLETQTSFLMKRGLIERVANLFASDKSEALAAKNLLVPGGIGDYCKVLIQEKPLQPR